MHIVLGGTGHAGAALADALVGRGEQVTIVTRGGRASSRQRDAVHIAPTCVTPHTRLDDKRARE